VSFGVSRSETRWVKLFEQGCRDRLTLGQMRQFVAEADFVELPDDIAVTHDAELPGTDSRWAVRLEARQRVPLDPEPEHESPEPGPLDSGPPFDPDAEPEVVEPPRPGGAES
jgi:hypothetical protein